MYLLSVAGGGAGWYLGRNQARAMASLPGRIVAKVCGQSDLWFMGLFPHSEEHGEPEPGASRQETQPYL